MAIFQMYHYQGGNSDKLWGYFMVNGITIVAHGRRGNTLVVEKVKGFGPDVASKKIRDGYSPVSAMDIPDARVYAAAGSNAPPTPTPASSNIASYRYHKKARRLFITFASGRVYEYQGVPQAVVDSFEAASSKGSFFNANIKGHSQYQSREIVPASTLDDVIAALDEAAFLFMTSKKGTREAISRAALPLARTVKDGADGSVHVTFMKGHALVLKLNGKQWSTKVSVAHSVEARLTLLAIAKGTDGMVSDDSNQAVAFSSLKEIAKAIRAEDDDLEDRAATLGLVKAKFKFSSIKNVGVTW